MDAIERLWESFAKDGIEFPSPEWHGPILAEREAIADSPDAEWLDIDQLQARLMNR